MSELIDSIYNKKLEIHYNEWTIKNDNVEFKIQLQGKIKCPVLGSSISSLVCSKLMERPGWPREIEPDICSKCSCYINLSIQKFKDKTSTKDNQNEQPTNRENK